MISASLFFQQRENGRHEIYHEYRKDKINEMFTIKIWIISVSIPLFNFCLQLLKRDDHQLIFDSRKEIFYNMFTIKS